MISVIPKWKVVYQFAVEDSITLYVNDRFYANVLRQVANIDFEFGTTVVQIIISLVDNQSLTSKVITTNTPYKSEFNENQ